MNFKVVSRNIAHWLGCFLLYLSAILLAGGLIGTFLYVTIGSLTHPDLSLSYRLSKGFTNGFFYAGVWATGLSIVFCVMRAHKERKMKATKDCE
ncbi:hypothetical protein [Rubellicoccus peritrichatus]|uniref:Uncharacterized protein n=1 Tax=Rubellicoccus peritrichatus TaxID=3080537 RepID=A0AAQ3LAZ7_9BACT|nr:hypothetical protein [Puniceicoccus sp. CR14]WOO42381.1 hypothetical protein RZN69_04715 [Puniceicoccus sp. CR14]